MSIDWAPVWLTLKLATASSVLLMIMGTPLAWWLSRSRSRLAIPIEALIALPLVLPPTVLGFYLLVLLGPSGPIGSVWEQLSGGRLVFSFGGLLVGSVIHSLPFVVQPLVGAFRSIDSRLLEAAAVHGAAPFDRFLNVAVPLCRPAFLA